MNADEDVYIFARYIAKQLGITRRFVGEEPTDKVTDHYNQKMKDVFPKFGIELIEIPRKQTNKGKYISASKVRAFLKDCQWEKIGNLVPPSTLEYLQQNREEIQKRSLKKNNAE